jgi:peptidoglycan/xylan/chitin deacetylase (PgdA/CDA1 family)
MKSGALMALNVAGTLSSSAAARPAQLESQDVRGVDQVLRQAKLSVLRLAAATGLSRVLARSSWRQQRLLILAYHGVSRYDEHEWDAGLYITPERLRTRMQLLVEERCNVLPLAEAVNRLGGGTLPPRAVAITFDDGYHDFHSVAYPIIESFSFPVTLYLTTYYVEYNRPVFDIMCSYLLWKGRARGRLEWPEVLPAPLALHAAGRQTATGLIKGFASSRKLSGQEKDLLLARLAERLGIDYEELCRKRVLHLLTPTEARELATRGVDLEYHTHRHRVYRDREQMFAELDDSRDRLESYTSNSPHHFCYPSGVFLPEHVGYLADYGIRSATTCLAGLCTARTNPLLLPRLVDTTGTSELEFRAWLAGTASLLPARAHEDSARPM